MFGSVVETKSITLTDPSAFELFGAIPTISGRSITAESAMRVPAVRAAVNIIAEMCGVIPFKIYEQDGDEKRTARDHPAYFIVHDEPNDFQGAEELRADLTRDALLNGSGYAFVSRVADRVQEMIRLEPTRVTPKQIALGTYEFHYQDGSGKRVLTQDEILRLSAPGGVSPIQHGREAIALALELEACAARLFSKGGRPSGVLRFPNKLGDEAAARMKAGWNAAHSGENSGGTAILEEGGEFDPFTFSSVDSEFAAMRRHQVIEIARLFNVPPTLLMDLTNGTYSNTEQLLLHFRTYTLAPWLMGWSRAYGRALLSSTERGRFYVEPVFDALNAADTAARSDAFGKLIAARVMTPNEARAAINLPAHPQGDDLANPYTTTTTTGPATVPAKEAA